MAWRRKGGADEQGFTLIELMVVLTILGVLLAIAVPTFFAARERSMDAAAKDRATTGAKAHHTYLADNVVLTDEAAWVAGLDQVEPGADFRSLTSEPTVQVKGAVYAKLESSDVATLVSRSSTGRCYWTRVAYGITSYAVTDCPDVPDVSDFRSEW